jgi:pimeloyl-ACP methyl ester carboxylesterase
MRSHAFVLLTALGASVAGSGCLSGTSAVDTTKSDAGGVAGDDPTQNANDVDVIPYRDMSSHPGCTTDGLAYAPAKIAGYPCAAKEYVPANEDTSKPIVLLVHGNSDSPAEFEICHPGADKLTGSCVDPSKSPPMLSERLTAAGFHTFAVDMRSDKSDDPTCQMGPTCNAAKNMDHGWGVPIVQQFVESVMSAYPDREISMVGFSYGPGVIRDALRRLHRAGKKPFAHIRDLVFVSGGNHGVKTYQDLCQNEQNPVNTSMAGRCACEMGNRTGYVATPFHAPLNGPDGAYETPCSDGSHAFGQTNVCGNHAVRYTTLVMRDISQGTYQDEFVSEAAAALQGADNETDDLTDQDQTLYFYAGAFKNHFGSIRSEAALTKIMSWLSR